MVNKVTKQTTKAVKAKKESTSEPVVKSELEITSEPADVEKVEVSDEVASPEEENTVEQEEIVVPSKEELPEQEVDQQESEDVENPSEEHKSEVCRYKQIEDLGNGGYALKVHGRYVHRGISKEKAEALYAKY